MHIKVVRKVGPTLIKPMKALRALFVLLLLVATCASALCHFGG